MNNKITNFYNKYINQTYNLISKKFAIRKLEKLKRKIGECSLVVGMPGTGKTTLCAYITSLCLKANVPIYCNVPILGAIPFTKDEFGKYDMSNSIILWDEGSLFFDNRSFDKNFNQESLEYLKLLRHRNNSCLICSQSIDIDVKWVRMSKNIFQLNKGRLFSCFTTLTPVSRELDVSEQTHKWEDFYYKPRGIVKFFKSTHLFRPFYYKYFDSYDAPVLPSLPPREVYSSKKGLTSFSSSNIVSLKKAR